jgi:hypothetical protein
MPVVDIVVPVDSMVVMPSVVLVDMGTVVAVTVGGVLMDSTVVSVGGVPVGGVPVDSTVVLLDFGDVSVLDIVAVSVADSMPTVVADIVGFGDVPVDMGTVVAVAVSGGDRLVADLDNFLGAPCSVVGGWSSMLSNLRLDYGYAVGNVFQWWGMPVELLVENLHKLSPQ